MDQNSMGKTLLTRGNREVGAETGQCASSETERKKNFFTQEGISINQSREGKGLYPGLGGERRPGKGIHHKSYL